MKHELKRYTGQAAVEYARRNKGAYLEFEPLEAITERYIEHRFDFEFCEEEIEELLAEYGPDICFIRGGISDAHDEAFFVWLMQECDYLRSRMFSTDFSDSLDASFDDEPHKDIGVDLDLVPLKDYTDLHSVTIECIGLRLAREGKLRALAAGDGYEFILPDAAPLKVWAVLASSKEYAMKALTSYKPAVILEENRDGYSVTFSSPTGRLE